MPPVSTGRGHFFASVDPPTLINLGFEWVISGDDNRNAKVDVSYRRKGTTEWKPAMPLMRIQHERTYWGNEKADDHIINVIQPNMFAGSILDLEPGTAYEARFVLTDPDGVSGDATHIVTVSTRSEPKPATGGHVYHVYPADWKGPREANSYIGLNCAYNYHCGGAIVIKAAGDGPVIFDGRGNFTLFNVEKS